MNPVIAEAARLLVPHLSPENAAFATGAPWFLVNAADTKGLAGEEPVDYPVDRFCVVVAVPYPGAVPGTKPDVIYASLVRAGEPMVTNYVVSGTAPKPLRVALGNHRCTPQVLSSFKRQMSAAVEHISRSSAVEAYQPAAKPLTSMQRAMKRGPLIEWRTVVIKPRAPKAEPKGGHHASPRQHDRRGHYVTSKLGKVFWRKQARVGKAVNGLVFHDYVVKPTPTPQLTGATH